MCIYLVKLYWVKNMERLEAEYYEELKGKITMQNLKKLIKDRGYTTLKVATSCKISDSTIYNYLKGERLPSVVTLIELANMLNCNLDYLLDRTDNPICIDKLDSLSYDEDTKALFQNILALPKDKLELVEAYVKGLLNN